MPSLDDAPLTYPLVDGRQFATTIWLNWLTTAAVYATAADLAIETAARIAAVSAEATARIDGISAEASARTAAIFAELSARNTAIAAAVATEVTNRNAAIATHAAAADPHTGYQQESEKNAASGYAGLSAGGKLDGAQQVYGSAANTALEGNDTRILGGSSATISTADTWTLIVENGHITSIS